MWQQVVALIAVASCVLPANGDLPVHCLRHEIVGKWSFTVSKPSPTRSSCGHQRPDVEESQPSRNFVDNLNHTTTVEALMSDPNIAEVQGQKGSWTMVYDEGFEVTVGSRVYFAFSNFTFEKNGASWMTHNVSHCGDTMVGWFSNKDRTEFGCYYGVKQVSASLSQKANKTVARHQVSSKSASKTPLSHVAQANRVANLNKKLAMLQVGWKARVMPQWNGKSMYEINSYAGLRRKVPSRDLHRDMMSQRNKEEPPKRRSFLQREGSSRIIRSGPLPSNFSWADVNGLDYTEPVMDQGDCGSCYDASTMRMLTARHKITINDTQAVPWSINFPLFCGEYNQGCKGGFGILTTKWSEDVGLIPATCMRYNTKGSCKLECDLHKEFKGQKRYRAANHRNINAFYGNFSIGGDSRQEEAIKNELYRNGPVVLSFEPGEDFMFYSEGIYKTPNKTTKLRKHIDYDQEWERVDHAVVAVGYGEEAGQKYWLIQNSWGADWGEDGFFRMARGIDESGIESVPEAADVVVDEQDGRQVDALFAEQAVA